MAVSHSIEFKSDFNDYWAVYEIGVYERGSVLAGQTRKRFVGSFDSEAEAKAAYPKASVGYYDANNTFGHLPDENDPVAGGMYPDDYDDGY